MTTIETIMRVLEARPCFREATALVYNAAGDYLEIEAEVMICSYEDRTKTTLVAQSARSERFLFNLKTRDTYLWCKRNELAFLGQKWREQIEPLIGIYLAGEAEQT